MPRAPWPAQRSSRSIAAVLSSSDQYGLVSILGPKLALHHAADTVPFCHVLSSWVAEMVAAFAWWK
jgi:hypothetical protein